MLAAKNMEDVQEDFKNLCDKVFSGEPLIVSRPKNENIVMVSEKEYSKMLKETRNAEYLAMLDESRKQIQEGNAISFSLEELREMESDDWKPTQEILEFERKNNIKRPGAENNE